jgi:hypothetical protein
MLLRSGKIKHLTSNRHTPVMNTMGIKNSNINAIGVIKIYQMYTPGEIHLFANRLTIGLRMSYLKQVDHK